MRARAALIAATLALGTPLSVAADELSPSMTVTGSATASARPDTAEVTTGVVTQAATAGQALAQNNAVMEHVLKTLTGLGVAERDIQTANLSVTPQRAESQPGRPRATPIVGYEVTNEVHVRVRNLAILGRLLDSLVGQGANALGGIAFSVADPAPLLEQARTRAVADARQKAQTYAMAAGAKLGRVVSIRDQTPVGPVLKGRLMKGAEAAPIAVGEQELQVSVSVTYGLE